MFTGPAPSADGRPQPGPLRPASEEVGRPARLHDELRIDGLHLRLSGDLDLAGVEPLRPILLRHLHAATGPITLDTRHVTHLSSAGVGLLVEAVDAASGRLALLVEPESAAGRILALTGLDDAGPSQRGVDA